MSADPIEFRNEAERKQWLLMYERGLASGRCPDGAAEYADDDMRIRRRVSPPPEFLDYVELLETARAALAFKRNHLPETAGAIADIDDQIARIDRARGVQP